MSPFRRYATLCVLTASVALTACADIPRTAQQDQDYDNDPLEPVNRAVFDVNDFLDRLLFRPLAELYRATIPPGIRDPRDEHHQQHERASHSGQQPDAG